MKRFYFLMSMAAIAFAGSAADEYCNNYPDANSAHASRHLSSITLTQGENNLTVNDIQVAKGKVYADCTSKVFTIIPGETVTLTPQGSGEWMHGYVWVDWNNDKEFTAKFNDVSGWNTSHRFFD